MSDLKTDLFFPTILGHSFYPLADLENKTLESHINKLIKGSNKCFYYHALHKDKKFNNLTKWILDKATEFADLHKFAKPYVEESWFNYYRKHDSNSPHYHRGSVLSAVYFLEGTPEDSPLIIRSPLPPDMMNPRKITADNPTKDLSPYTIDEIVIKPKTGYLYIFRSYLQHEVSVKLNDSRRIALSYTFNIT
jgi:uncharacterized protein (TIGR02466 family)